VDTQAELSAEIEHQTALDSTVGLPKPLGARGAVVADTIGLPFVGVRKGVGLLWGIGRRQVGNLAKRARKGNAAPPSQSSRADARR
jgi:membrane protein